jgi:hypothetical protein
VSAFGEFAYYRLAGGYWSPEEEDYRRVSLGFVRPAPEWVFWKYWAPKLDTCSHIDSSGGKDWEYDPGLERYDARAGTLTVQELSNTSIDLDWNASSEIYEKQDLAAAQYIPGGVYTGELGGSPVLPDLDLDGLFFLPEAFEVTSPDIEALELPMIDQDIPFRWTGGSGAAAVLLQVGMMNSSGKTFQEQVYCAVEDDGSFDLPGELWTTWANGRLLNLLVGRYLEGEAIVPFSGGAASTAGQYWFYGAGTTE